MLDYLPVKHPKWFLLEYSRMPHMECHIMRLVTLSCTDLPFCTSQDGKPKSCLSGHTRERHCSCNAHLSCHHIQTLLVRVAKTFV